MKSLKHIRVAIALAMLVEGVVWVVLGILAASKVSGGEPDAVVAPEYIGVTRMLQITPSLAAAGLGATIGAALFWLVVTFILGRVYCSTTCPVGTLQDVAIRFRHFLPGRRFKHFAYKKPSSIRFLPLGIYIVAMIVGIGCIPLLLEPWPTFVNAITELSGSGMHYTLVSLGVGSLLGLVCAILSVLFVFAYAMMTGRDFCNEVCPVGTLLRMVGSHSVMHIELYPDKCTACLKCQDVCKASCIDIKTRTIDNARCIRCFNCINVCDDDAIRFTLDHNGVITGLFQKELKGTTPS
ncbi:MAG: 4Fe-4S binding protein [Muribaculaceae bacterium]|nr:4Fe-4S binding protein [Muribaculaceae bacterium]